MKVSLGWENSDGFSENQDKTFTDEESAFAFCKKHLGKIIRINGTRLRRDFENNSEKKKELISDEEIRKALKDK